MGGDAEEKRAATRTFTRRRFLGASAGVGAGLLVLGLGGYTWSGREESSPFGGSSSDLEILLQGYPRALFFRQPEVEDRRGNLSYKEWEKRYLPLNGIVGKALDESNEHAGMYDTLPFFLRYKENNPSKVVILHYHGAGRRATDTVTDFFAGHWLYYEGTSLTRKVDASASATVLYVADTSVFSLDRVEGAGEDVVIAPVGDDGKPDWDSAEQVRLEEIDDENETITVERGAYGTVPRPFPAGSYLAPHVLTPPYPSQDNSERDVNLWSYNFSTVGPRDVKGRNGADALADYLADKLGSDGPLAAFDGIVFDGGTAASSTA
ncbi:MAG: twin-arginine translocation signal domain-containing protein [Actinobacteria bacterium]|nr:twin-arginine translocation signal domain-containing protein [Actinomycetota bacterium]